VEISRCEAGATEAGRLIEVLWMSVEPYQGILTRWESRYSRGAKHRHLLLRSNQSRFGDWARIVRLAATTSQHLRHPESPERDVLIGEVRSECLSDGESRLEPFVA